VSTAQLAAQSAVTLTEDMRRLVLEQKLGFAATVCPDGTPNLSPKGTTTVWDDTHLDVTKGEHDESLRRRSEPCNRRPALPN
jgi:predicted pyridoxine 5'-phosphate oxidase superfamily flavin-nucleotide-binding protein